MPVFIDTIALNIFLLDAEKDLTKGIDGLAAFIIKMWPWFLRWSSAFPILLYKERPL